MKTFKEWLDEQPVDESLTGALFRAARLSDDVRALVRSVETGSPKPIMKRLTNKLLGRKLGRRIYED